MSTSHLAILLYGLPFLDLPEEFQNIDELEEEFDIINDESFDGSLVGIIIAQAEECYVAIDSGALDGKVVSNFYDYFGVYGKKYLSTMSY